MFWGVILTLRIASLAMVVAFATAIRQIVNATPAEHSLRAQQCARFLLCVIMRL